VAGTGAWAGDGGARAAVADGAVWGAAVVAEGAADGGRLVRVVGGVLAGVDHGTGSMVRAEGLVAQPAVWV